MERIEEKDIEQTSSHTVDRQALTADVYSIVRDVLKNLWVIIIVGLSAAFLAYTVAWISYHPQYVSQTTFVVSARGSSTGAYANLSQTQQLAEVFKTVLDSDVLKKKVADSLGKDSFDGTVAVSIVPETNLLSVSVTADSPTTAFQLLNTMLDEYPSVSQNVLGEVVLEVFEEPNYPSYPTMGFAGNEMMKRGFLLGAGAMVVLFALMSYFRDGVKNEKEVEAKLDTSLFAVLYHERKYRNISAFFKRDKKILKITDPSVSFGFGETIKKIRTKVLYQQKKKGGEVLVITSAGPGEGKTTLAVNLALSLADNSRKVLLIEGNLRTGALRTYLDLSDAPMTDWGSVSSVKDFEAAVYYDEKLHLYIMTNQEKVQYSAEKISSSAMSEFLAL